MREAAFLKKNSDRWKELEKMLSGSGTRNPDLLADYFVQLTDDLAYSRTHYPESNTTAYLNSLASKAHLAIYKNKKEKGSRFIRFWRDELPLEFRRSHRQFLYSFIIFLTAGVVGALSAAYDDTFVRLIMGDDYVNMTLDNIEKGDPMAVYKSMHEMGMFAYITMNNIYVSFLAFIWGIAFSVGTGYMLVSNGIMLGSFQYFFYQKGLLTTSVLTIWIHGTLEISAIIIAGGAGLTMGNSFLFPGTYSRLYSLKQGAKRGMKIVIGLVPVFIMAGFLESFVTRHTEYHWTIKVTIIGLSAAFIIWYFIIYPLKRYKHGD